MKRTNIFLPKSLINKAYEYARLNNLRSMAAVIRKALEELLK